MKKQKHNIKSIIAFFSAILFSSSSSAGLVTNDWLSAGDGLLTYDSVSGLKWLDLSYTFGQSLNGVLGQTALGNPLNGFRVATSAEVLSLYTDAGINFGYSGYDVAQASAANLLQSLMGGVGIGGSREGGTWIESAGFAMNSGNVNTFIIEHTTGGNVYAPYSHTWSAGMIGEGHVQNGTYLVMANVVSVPEPSSVSLLISGYIAVLIARKPKRGRRNSGTPRIAPNGKKSKIHE